MKRNRPDEEKATQSKKKKKREAGIQLKTVRGERKKKKRSVSHMS